MKIISREEARALGLKRYFTGKPCIHAHLSTRNVASCECHECNMERSRRDRTANPEKFRERKRKNYAATREKCREQRRKNYAANSEKFRKKTKESYALNIQKRREYARKYMAKNRENKNESHKERYRKIRDLIEVLRVEKPELLKEFGL